MFTPENEMGVIVLFSQQAESKGFEITKIQSAFPDAIVRWRDQDYKVEFEYVSSNFDRHGHDPRGADLIICWERDCDSILPILALSETDWAEQEIELPSEIEREVVYWRLRAIQAERDFTKLRKTLEDKAERNESLMSEGEFSCPYCEKRFGSPQAVGAHLRWCAIYQEQQELAHVQP